MTIKKEARKFGQVNIIQCIIIIIIVQDRSS